MTDKSHLLRFGYAPGSYWFVCRDCGNKFAVGDKRATRCEACAETLYSQVSSVEAVADKYRAMTTVSEEAVKAAAKCYLERAVSINKTASSLANAMLTAALPHLPQGVGEREAMLNYKAKLRVAFRKALSDLPEIAPTEIASILSSVHMQDEFWKEGKRLQLEHGLDAVAPRVEQECGAGAWSFIRRGILSALEPSAAQERCRDCDGYNCDDGCAYPEPSAARELALEEVKTSGATDVRGLIKTYANAAFEQQGKDIPKYIWHLHFEEFAAAIRALPSPDHADAGKVEGDGWLPIESAPKDGTEIWGWHKVAGPSQTRFYDGEWCCVDWNEDQYIACTWEPSHWRPLPSAPSQEVAGS